MYAYFGLDDNEAVINKHKILSHLVDTNNSNLVALLNPFLPFNFDETEDIKNMEPTGKFLKTIDLLVSLLSQGTPYDDRSLIIVIDDAKWCDSSSWNLIAQISKRAQNLLLFVALRHIEGANNEVHYKEVLAGNGVEHIVLSTLPTHSIRKYLCSLLQVPDVSDNLLELMEHKACSNLLYIQEAITSMAEDGLLVLEHGVCVLKAGSSNEVDMPNR